jgi:hypothetical protein
VRQRPDLFYYFGCQAIAAAVILVLGDAAFNLFNVLGVMPAPRGSIAFSPVGRYAAVGVAGIIAVILIYIVVTRRQELRKLAVSLRADCPELLSSALTGAAGILAGRRYAHLPGAWAGDMYDPGTGQLLPVSRRFRLAWGNLMAAARCRLDDATELAWRPVDVLVSSWHGSNLAVLLPVTIAVGLILPREGFYGLIANAENLGVIAAGPYAAIKGLRKYRQIDTPKRPEKKASSADGSGQRPG